MIKGMDLSTLLEVRNLGGRFFDKGVEKNPVHILKDYGFNSVRLRLWNDPYDEAGNPYGAGTNDLKTTLTLAKECKKEQLGILLDYQYSDFWADPGKQIKPKAWKNMSVSKIRQAISEYTRSTLLTLVAEGIHPQMIQIGNELSNGLLWPEGKTPHYDLIAEYLSAGIKAVREIDASIPIMLHLDQGGNNQLYREWFDHAVENQLDFDVIGLSYYPFWHGTLQQLSDNMEDIGNRYKKNLVVAEVSMGYTMKDYGSWEQLKPQERIGMATRKELVEKIEYPMTKEGQAGFMQEFMERIMSNPYCKGFYYWEPAWIPVPGSGWATEASLKYMNSPGPVGNEWANQALFDYDGNTLPVLPVIRDF